MKLLFLTVGLLSRAVLGDVFSFTTQPSTMTVEKGSTFTLSCATQNGVSTTYQWYKEDTVPNTVMTSAYSGSDATSSSIVIAGAALTDGGFYQCKATSDGQDSLYSETAQVIIHYFNTLGADNANVNIDSDTKAVRYALECLLEDDVSYPEATIQWYKDNQAFSHENAFVVHEDTILKVESLADLSAPGGSLVLFNIKSDMAGTYSCKATVDSDQISVTTQTVNSYDVMVSTEFGDVDYSSTTLAVNGDSVTSGESVTLCCGTIGYNSGDTPTYTWHATNGDAVTVTENLSDYNRTMTLDSATTSHSYTCKACLAGNCESSVVTASVTPSTAAIEFTTEPASYYLYEDGSSEGALTITCKTSLGEGNWMKNGESVSFPISSPAKADSGYYQCYASNTDSWVMVSTQVLVTEAMLLELTVPNEIDSATTGTITCVVTGYPSPDVAIYKTNVNDENESIDECYDSPATSTNCIRNSGSYYYITVDNTDLDSTGTYTCQATQTYMAASTGANKVKLSEDSGELAVIQDVSVTEFTTDSADLEYGDAVTFTCVVSGGRAPYKVEMKYDGADVYVWSNNEADQFGDGVCTGDFVKTCKGKITSVNYAHEGSMTCTGYNTAANSTTKTDSMTLDTTVTRAVYTEITGDFFPVLGTHLTLTCNHHEKPFSFDESVTWTKDGDSIVPDSSTAGSNAASYYGTVVGVFNDMSSDSEGTYKCKSENVESAGVEVYVDQGIPPSDPSMNVPDGEVGKVLTLTCSAEGYPPPTLTWTLYDSSVDNVTTVTKEKYETTSELVWSPSAAVEMTITCTATNDNGTAATEATMTIITAEQANQDGISDSELAAIIAACIIAGVILFICIAFIIICICQHRRARKHDGDGTIIEKGPSKIEQTCLASCIACCPCCFRSDPSDTELEEDKPEGKWSFPSLPKFNFSFITSEKVETPPTKKSYFKRHKADVTKLSKREKIADSPEPIKKRLGSLRDSIKQKISPDEEPTTGKPGSPTAEKRSALKRPSFKRSHHSLPRGETPSKDKGKSRHRRNSAEDTPLAMKISHFFHIESPFIKYDEEKQEYERTLSRVSKTERN